ncbi:MAG: Uma2 family endonuclease [Acidobacteriota bacterium]
MQQLAIKSFTPHRFPISVKIFHVMAAEGVFAPTDRVELIDGEIFNMSPIGTLHARCVNWLSRVLGEFVGRDFIVSIQNPIVLDDASEPQPDISILRYRDDFYKNETPWPRDVLMIFEVADTSVEFDRNIKLPRYAAAGIPETWLIDLVSERVEVHSEPKENTDGTVKIFQRGENAASHMIANIDLSLDEILG